MNSLTLCTFATVCMFWTTGCQFSSPQKQHIPESATKSYPLGELAIRYSSHKTLEELAAWARPRDSTEGFYLFEGESAKIALCIQSWGSGDHWNAIVIFAFDSLRNQWTPRVVWNAETTGVRAVFDKGSGEVRVVSGKGIPIFQANIAALASYPTREW